jgi:uncharacterized Ntn-hydrolase superfamily protein
VNNLVTSILLLVAAAVFAQERRPQPGVPSGPDPWFSTFSIIAFDPATNELGVAVQSRAFAAGAAVPFAKPGIGAVATQAAANRLYGPKAIALLEQGLTPEEVVKRITDEDPGRDTRQVAVIDTKGRSAVYTGKHVIDRNFDAKDPVHYGGYAGHVTGKNFSVQGNTLASEAVVKAIADAYEGSTGSMADRFMDALDAGQSKGGDMRGMQSAGILVVKPIPPNSESTVERIVDIRVDDATNPFVELRRLLQITEGAPAKLTEHAAQLAKDGKFKESIAEQQKAIAITPNNEQLQYALAQRYAQAGQYDDAVKSLEVAVHKQAYFKKRAAEDPLFAKMKGLAAFRRLVGS